jgi:hypothetical protein
MIKLVDLQYFIGFITLLSGGALYVAWQLSFAALYRHLSRSHAKYYQSIGAPLAPINHTWVPGEASRQLKGLNYQFLWTSTGLPSAFPRDKFCRQFSDRLGRYRTPLKWLLLLWGLLVIALVVLIILSNGTPSAPSL